MGRFSQLEKKEKEGRFSHLAQEQPTSLLTVPEDWQPEIPWIESEGIVDPSGAPVERPSPVAERSQLAQMGAEIPENLRIGTIGLAANLLSAIKRRAMQLSGGGAVPDEVLRHQYEAVTPQRQQRPTIFGEPPRLPGAIAGEAAGVVTRLPDIGSKILRAKQQELAARQEQVSMENKPLIHLSRLVMQSGVPSVGAAIGASLLTGDPLVGLLILGETEGGAAFESQLEAGASVLKANIIAELSGAAEIGGEMLVFPKFIRGLKEGIPFQQALRLIAENATQEGVTGFAQRFLEVIGKETTKGTPVQDAAVKAFDEGVKAIPENAFVGGATAGLIDIPGTAIRIAKTPPKAKAPEPFTVQPLLDEIRAEGRRARQQRARDKESAEARVEAEIAAMDAELGELGRLARGKGDLLARKLKESEPPAREAIPEPTPPDEAPPSTPEKELEPLRAADKRQEAKTPAETRKLINVRLPGMAPGKKMALSYETKEGPRGRIYDFQWQDDEAGELFGTKHFRATQDQIDESGGVEKYAEFWSLENNLRLREEQRGRESWEKDLADMQRGSISIHEPEAGAAEVVSFEEAKKKRKAEEAEPEEGELLLSKDDFPEDIGGGLDHDVRLEDDYDERRGRKWSVAMAKQTRLNKQESEKFRLKLEELTGHKWIRDPVSKHIFHIVIDTRKKEAPKAEKKEAEEKPPIPSLEQAQEAFLSDVTEKTRRKFTEQEWARDKDGYPVMVSDNGKEYLHFHHVFKGYGGPVSGTIGVLFDISEGETFEAVEKPTGKAEPELKEEIAEREAESELETTGVSKRRRNRIISDTEKDVSESDLYKEEVTAIERMGREVDVGFYHVPENLRAEVEDIIGEVRGFPTKLQKMFTFDPTEGANPWDTAVQDGLLVEDEQGRYDSHGEMDISDFVWRVKEAMEARDKWGKLNARAVENLRTKGDPWIQYKIAKLEMLREGQSPETIDEMTAEFAEAHELDPEMLDTEWVGAEPLKLKQIKTIEDPEEQDRQLEVLARELVLKEEREQARTAVRDVLKANGLEEAVEVRKTERIKEPAPIRKTVTTADGKRIAALRKSADSLSKQIEQKRHPAIADQPVTHRRANIAGGMAKEADYLERQQQALYAIADAIEQGTLPRTLETVKTRTDVEAIMRGYFSLPDMHRSHYNELLEKTKGMKGSREARENLRGVVIGENRASFSTDTQVEAIEKLLRLAEKKAVSTRWMKDGIAEGKRFVRLGIKNKTDLEQAKTDLEGLLKPKPKTAPKEIEIREKTHALIGRKIPGFFPTPKPVIEQMIDLADIQEGDYVLEPSAGKGDIADALKEAGARVDVAEIAPSLQDILKLRGHQLIGTDFLEMKLSAPGVEGLDVPYDKIVMNPPFEKGQDIEHVRHAYDLLKPGGRIVSVMSPGPFFKTDKKSQAFREWLDTTSWWMEHLPEGAFKGKEAFRQTGVASRLVVIDKEVLGDEMPFERRGGEPVGAAFITPAGQEIVLLAYGADSATGYHEAYHVLRRRLADKDVAALNKIFRGDQEAEADAFAEYAKTGKAKASVLKGIWDKLVKILRKIKSALQGMGYRTAEDIFAELAAGDYAFAARRGGPVQYQRDLLGQERIGGPPQRLPYEQRQEVIRDVAQEEAWDKTRKGAFEIYKKALPNATEAEVVQAMLEDGLQPPREILEKYEDLPEVKELLEQKRTHRLAGLARREARRPAPAVEDRLSVKGAIRQALQKRPIHADSGSVSTRIGEAFTVADTKEAVREMLNDGEIIIRDGRYHLAEQAERPTKEPWEMTREQFDAARPKTRSPKFMKLIDWASKEESYAKEHLHKTVLKRAIHTHKPVPRQVLEEYLHEKWAAEALVKTRREAKRRKQVKAIPVEIGPRLSVSQKGGIYSVRYDVTYHDGTGRYKSKMRDLTPDEVGRIRKQIKEAKEQTPKKTAAPPALPAATETKRDLLGQPFNVGYKGKQGELPIEGLYEHWRPKGRVKVKTDLVKAVDAAIEKSMRPRDNSIHTTPEKIARDLATTRPGLFYKPSYPVPEVAEAWNQLVQGGPLFDLHYRRKNLTRTDRLIADAERAARVRGKKERLKKMAGLKKQAKKIRGRIQINIREVTPVLSKEMGQAEGARRPAPPGETLRAKPEQTRYLGPEFKPDEPLESKFIEAQEAKRRELSDEWYKQNIKKTTADYMGKARRAGRSAWTGIEKVFTASSTRLYNIHPLLFREVRRYAYDVLNRTTDMLNDINPFLKAVKKMSKKDRAELDLALKNAHHRKIGELIAKYGLEQEYAEARDVLDEIYSLAKEVGIEIDYRRDYWHRHLNDPAGFLEYFQKGENWSLIEQAIKSRAQRSGRKVEELTVEEKAKIVNTLLRGYRTQALVLSRPGAAKERTIDIIDRDLNQFYDDFANSITRYIKLMNGKIAEREFFGSETKEIVNLRRLQSQRLTRLIKLQRRQGLKEGSTETKYQEHISKTWQTYQADAERLQRLATRSPTETIGGYVFQLQQQGHIRPDQEQELQGILQGIFNPRGMSRLGSLFSTGIYLDTLNSPLQALTQVEEFVYSFYRAPLKSIPVAIRTALRRSKVTPEDIGIHSIGEEFQGPSMRRALSTMLRATGFEQIDRLNKENYINTALADLQAQARKKKPSATFHKRLARVFGGEYKQVVEDLRKPIRGIEDASDNVKYLLFNQILDIQPIAKTEMPEAYNKGGNLRLLYTLKTFYMRRLDFIRNECLKDMKSPKTFVRGFSKLVWLAFCMALMGAGVDALKDFIRGRKFDLSDSVVDTLLKCVFLSKYSLYRARTEGAGRAVMERAFPPTKAIDELSKDIQTIVKDKPRGFELWRSVPVVGELYYWWFGRGRQKIEEQEGQRKTWAD